MQVISIDQGSNSATGPDELKQRQVSTGTIEHTRKEAGKEEVRILIGPLRREKLASMELWCK